MITPDIRELPAIRLFVLLITFFITLIVTGLIATGIGNLEMVGPRGRILLTSAIQCVLAFCLPAWLTARFCSNHPIKWLYLDKMPSIWSYLGVVVSFLIALPALNWVVEWNANIHFPATMKGLEETLRGWEETNGGIVETMLKGASPLFLGMAVIVVGLLTGFSEEMFFRGGVQNILTRTNIPTWVAVWGSAILFSALHFQFFGFIPRMLMGAFFGYLFVWSRSLWLPIFAHAFNNSIVVLTFNSGMADQKEIFENIGTTQEGVFPWLALGSGLAFGIFLFFFQSYLIKRKGVKRYG